MCAEEVYRGPQPELRIRKLSNSKDRVQAEKVAYFYHSPFHSHNYNIITTVHKGSEATADQRCLCVLLVYDACARRIHCTDGDHTHFTRMIMLNEQDVRSDSERWKHLSDPFVL